MPTHPIVHFHSNTMNFDITNANGAGIGRSPRHHRSQIARWRLRQRPIHVRWKPCGHGAGPPIEVGGSAASPAALHQMFSRSAAVRRATIEVETTAGVFRQRSIKVQSTRGAILRMLQKKDGNSMAAKQFLWL